MQDIRTKLTQLKEMDAHLDIIQMDKNRAIESVLAPEIKAELNAIDTEFDEITASIKTTIAVLEAEIKQMVLESGVSVKKSDNSYGAAFVRGRVSWNAKALNGYAAAHPEIEQFRKVGNESVRISRKT